MFQGKLERRPSLKFLRMRFGPGVEKGPDDPDMILPDGIVERGKIIHGGRIIFRSHIDIRPGRDQGPNRLLALTPDTMKERCVAFGVAGVNLCAPFQQNLHDFSMTCLGRDTQRCLLVFVFLVNHIDISAFGNESLDLIDVTISGCLVE